MPDQQSIRFDFLGIASVLSTHSLSVPKYQRSFAWTEQEVQEFLSDVLTAHDTDEPDYFIGSIVLLSPQPDHVALDVVDGQQRLATTSIFLAALRDAILLNDKNEIANSIDADYLQKYDIEEEQHRPKLTLNERDNSSYIDGILEQDQRKRKQCEPAVDSHRLLASAACIAQAEALKLVIPTDLTRAKSVLKYFKDSVKASLVIVPSTTNAFRVFEALNDRGLPLALSDLVKNFLFGCAGTRLAEVQARWTEMYAQFERTESEASVVDFIRQTWSSHYGLVRKARLFDRVKQRIKKPSNAVDISDRLAQSARTYQAIRSGNDPFWSDFSDTVKKHVTNTRYLSVSRPYPTLLAILETLQPKKMGDAIAVVNSLTVRLLITKKIGQGTVEEAFSDAAVAIRESKIKSSAALRAFFKSESIWPTDRVFQDAFSIATMPSHRIARYLLAAIEVFRQNDPHPELVPNLAPETTSLEHVLPQRPSEDWDISEDERLALSPRLGNLVLLGKKKNERIGNKGPKDKQSALLKSTLTTTKEVGEAIKKSKSSWTETEIAARQQLLAADAVRIWK